MPLVIRDVTNYPLIFNFLAYCIFNLKILINNYKLVNFIKFLIELALRAAVDHFSWIFLLFNSLYFYSSSSPILSCSKLKTQLNKLRNCKRIRRKCENNENSSSDVKWQKPTTPFQTFNGPQSSAQIYHRKRLEQGSFFFFLEYCS